MLRPPHALAYLLPALCLLTLTASAEDWSRFRGPNGSGIAPESGYPTEFLPAKAVWRAPIRSGKSSPVLTKRHVFTVAFENGKFYTQCFDRASGRLLWERSEDRPRRAPEHRLNEPASHTPVTDGENVYVFFKDIGLISYDSTGRRRWKTPLGPFTNYMGLAASPILAGGRLILQVDQSTDSYLAAFQPATGEKLWHIPRTERDSWATPLLYQPPSGEPSILTASGGAFGAHALKNGARLWSQPGLSPAIVASPVLAGNTAFVFGYGYETPVPFSDALDRFDKNKDGVLDAGEYGEDAWLLQVSTTMGDRKPPVTVDEWDAAFKSISTPSAILAIRMDPDPSKPGAVNPRLLWRVQRSLIGVVPSPLVYQDVLYIIRNGGILTAFDSQTGATLKAGRLPDAVGPYSASPVAAEGRVYFASEDGKLTVLKAGREWEVLHTSDLGEPVFATPAFSEGIVYIRTNNSLLAFAKR